MNIPALVLCPDDPQWIPPDDKQLDSFLRSIQLAGQPLDQPMHFLTGEKFLDLIAFMGCAPNIRLGPDTGDGPFCYIGVYAHAPAIEFHCGQRPHVPRCPECRSPVSDWQDRIQTWRRDQSKRVWECAVCHSQALPWEYNWRKSAGFGRCFIEIRNVFPKEAVPQQGLLDALHSRYGIKWHYFYQN